MTNKSQNVKVINFNGHEVMFSYNTPVAAFVPGRGYIQTDKKYSVTTSKHVNQYTERRGTVVPEVEFRAVISTHVDGKW